MKRLLKISAVILAAGIILIIGGMAWVGSDDVNMGNIYSIIENNIGLDSNVEYSEPEPYDLSAIKNKSNSNTMSEGLNEFNTLDVYCKDCEVVFEITNKEIMTASMTNGKMLSAISSGTLYVQTEGTSDKAKLTVGVPEIYKGGFNLETLNSSVSLCDMESAMDMKINLHGSAVNSGELSADSISISTNASTFSAENLTSADGVMIAAESSEMSIKRMTCVYSALTANSSTVNMNKISGAYSADVQRTTLDADFANIKGNISLDFTACSANIIFPQNAAFSQTVTEDKYSLFTDKTKFAQNGDENSAAHYTMETNMKFSIVSMS